MADEEEKLMRELLEEKTMEVDMPKIEAEPSDCESNKKKSRKSTPKKTNPNPKWFLSSNSLRNKFKVHQIIGNVRTTWQKKTY